MAPIRKKSGVWLYFVETDDPEAPRCTICKETATRKGGNTNQMTSHLRRFHRAEYEHVAKTREDQLVRSRQCAQVMAENITVTASLFSSNSFLSMFPLADRRNFPSRTTLMARVIPEMANEIREKNKKMLEGKPVCLVADSWTAKNGVVCLTAVVAYCITDNWTQEGVLLEAKRTTGKHTAVRIAALLKEVIDYYHLDVTAIMTDSAANIRAGVRSLGYFNPRCVSHLLHIAVRKGLSSWKGKATLKKVRKVSTLLNKSATAREEYFEYCKASNLRQVVVPQAVDTRWNSEFHGVARVNEQMEAVNQLLGSVKRDKFKSTEVVRLRMVEHLLQKLSLITSMVCREGTHIGEALLAFHEAKTHLKSIMLEDEPETKRLAYTIREELKKKEKYYRLDKTVLLYTFFDPSKVNVLGSIKWRKFTDLLRTEHLNFFRSISASHPPSIVAHDVPVAANESHELEKDEKESYDEDEESNVEDNDIIRETDGYLLLNDSSDDEDMWDEEEEGEAEPESDDSDSDEE